MIIGMPADIANATNRVGVLLQSVSGIAGFKKYNKLASHDLPAILSLTILDSVFGVLTALVMSAQTLKYVLLGSMIVMSLVMILVPSLILPNVQTAPKLVGSTPSSWLILFISGFYGGLIQAGVGFILLFALAGSSLRFSASQCFKISVYASIYFKRFWHFYLSRLNSLVAGSSLGLG
jgi:uncharacterized membrane protein YfcA